MNCCLECFSSNYIRDIILKNSNQIGNCDFCDSKNVHLYAPRELYFQFKNLLDLYRPITEVDLIAKYSPSKIAEQIIKDFPNKIFKIPAIPKINDLLLEIIKDDNDDFKDIFNNLVYLECLTTPLATMAAEMLKLSWSEFAEEIKFQNRYHISHVLDLEKLKVLVRRHVKEYPKGKIFYRARISNKSGFQINEMGCPPINKARAGRANPDGISYLYVANDIDTTVYETKAYLYDYISIGEFRIKENILVVNLRETQIFDPMVLADNEDLEDFLIHLPFINHLEQELSKPVRRDDNELDYIPTQYLSEFIKSQDYDAIEYKSSLNPRGYNLAVFNFDKMECIKTYVREIKEITYHHSNIS